MHRARIYTARLCPYCAAAKALLEREHIDFQEIDISGNWEARDEMITRSKGQTHVPQIFFGERHIGGLNDLKKLQESGRISRILDSV